MKFKVGDRVKVKKDLVTGKAYGKDIFIDAMEKYKGKIVIIKAVFTYSYAIKEDRGNWAWTDEMFEDKKEYTYEDLKESPIGTKITFENKIVLIKLNKGYYRENREAGIFRNSYDLRNLKDNFGNCGEIIKIEEPEYKTVYVSKVEILDEAEKRYLRGVIRPFRDRVEYIQKFTFSTGEAKITIKTEKDNDTWYVGLPPFKKDAMYKNMEPEREYTLEELGL